MTTRPKAAMRTRSGTRTINFFSDADPDSIGSHPKFSSDHQPWAVGVFFSSKKIAPSYRNPQKKMHSQFKDAPWHFEPGYPISIAKRSATKLRLHPRGERSCALSRSPARPSTLAWTTSKARSNKRSASHLISQSWTVTPKMPRQVECEETMRPRQPIPALQPTGGFFFPEPEECEWPFMIASRVIQFTFK